MGKTILLGTVKGIRNRGRQRKNIKDLTGLEFGESVIEEWDALVRRITKTRPCNIQRLFTPLKKTIFI